MKHVNLLIVFGLMILPVFIGVAATFSNPPEAASFENHHIAADNPFLRGPTVNLVTNNSALIFWRTADDTDATVQYGLNTSLLENVSNSTLDTDHRISLTGLQLDSKYWYKVISNGLESEVYHFKTAPADGSEFKLLLFGDNRPDSQYAPVQPQNYLDLIDLAIEEDPHVVIHSGDFVYRVENNHEENLLAWEHFNNATDKLGHYAPIYGVLGNHDTGSRTGTRLLSYFFDAFEMYDEPSAYYSFDYAGVHITILDSEELGYEGRIIGDQWEWLVEDLTSSSAPMKFVIAHRPMYPLSHIGDSFDVNEDERVRLQQLFEDTNVTLFGCGHDHLYNRMTVNGVTNIISGGAGAPLYSTPWGGAVNHYVRIQASYNSVDITAIKVDGAILDEYHLPYTGPIEISLRVVANTSKNRNGTMPEIYFSEIPATKYFSWDDGTNMSTLTGLPDMPGNHTLDVYAENTDGIWSHEHFVFETTNPDWSTIPHGLPIDVRLIGLIGVVSVVIVVVVILILKRRAS
jgi:hypothetical protein